MNAKGRDRTDAAGPDDVPTVAGRRLQWLGSFWATALLCLLTIGLLTLSFAPLDGWFLAYVALAPWTLAVALARRRPWRLWAATVTGLVFWAVNLYWLTWITMLGYVAGSLYLTAFWFVAAWALSRAAQRKLPMCLMLPLVWVALEFLRAYGVGFPWFYLAHSQYARTALIQIADVTGQYGVSFAVAMVNGLVVDAILLAVGPPGRAGIRKWRRVLIGGAATVVVLGGLLGYGAWRLGQQTRSAGPVLGIVQRAIPTTLRGDDEPPGIILEQYLTASEALVHAQCDLVIWPESVVPAGMNPPILKQPVDELAGEKLRGLAQWFLGPGVHDPVLSDVEVRHALRRKLKQRREQAREIAFLSVRLRCPILTGATTMHFVDGEDIPRQWVLRNSALWFDRSRWASSTYYYKVHLVPFSEAVPFKRSWPALHGLLRRVVPPVMPQLDAGSEFIRFRLQRRGRTWHVATPICYEGTFARICRRMVVSDGRKTTDILVNLSNDGWFVRKGATGDRLSSEHAQHLTAYCFRAVENRVPVVRAVNTGISASIDSNGRILVAAGGRDGLGAGSPMAPATILLDGQVGGEQADGVRHGPKVLVDSRRTVYSSVGDVFAIAVCVAAALMMIGIHVRTDRRSDVTP